MFILYSLSLTYLLEDMFDPYVHLRMHAMIESDIFVLMSK